MASSSKYSEGTSCSGLSSSSSSSTCSSSSSSFMAADQMVKVEIEAAEALADLAVLAVRESGGEPSEAKWESKWKGKRARKEVKTESPICGFVDSLPSRVDLDLRIQVVDYLFFSPQGFDWIFLSVFDYLFGLDFGGIRLRKSLHSLMTEEIE